MSTACIAIQEWNAEYYETMAVTTRARLAIETMSAATKATLHSALVQAKVARGLWKAANDFEELIQLLRNLETYPSAVLMDDHGRQIPPAIRDLFRLTCGLLQSSHTAGLMDNFLTRSSLMRIEKHN